MKNFHSLILFSLFSLAIYSQDYNAIDDKVKQYPKQFRSVEYLASRISKDFITDIEKTRALYFWLANNMSYDYDDANDGDSNYKSIKSTSNEEYEAKLLQMQIKYANKCLQKRMAVCEGFSQIMKHTLDLLDVECIVVSGYAKRNAREIGRVRNNSNHVWNAVKIDGNWKLIDATWSVREFKKSSVSFDDTYFLIKPRKLILSHLPKNQKWQLLKKPVSKSKFFYNPVIYYTFYKSGLELNDKTAGLIKVKTGNKIKLIFSRIDDASSYSYEFKGTSFTSELKFKKVKNNYVAEIPFTSSRNTELTIYCNYKSVLEFKILADK